MIGRHISLIAAELSLPETRVRAAASLLQDGDTIPFIARYRKEATGSLDELTLAPIRDRLRQLANLDARRRTILASLHKLGHLTPELKAQIHSAPTLTALEDLYLSYRPKRHTRASDAKARGLEPLAQLILAQHPGVDPYKAARKFVNRRASVSRQLRVPSPIAALQGARDILAELIADHPDTRAAIRTLFWERGVLRSTVRPGKQQSGAHFKHYFSWSCPIAGAPSYAIHAIRRGEVDGVLSVSVRPPDGAALARLRSLFLRAVGGSVGFKDPPRSAESVKHLLGAIKDGYHRLLAPSIETEVRAEARRRADLTAIDVFSTNLRQLLLAPPLGRKRVLAIDPGQRTGCKVAVLDPNGDLLDHTVIFPPLPLGEGKGEGSSKPNEAAITLTHLVQTHHVDAIAIGRGTAGRETEAFVRSLSLPATIPIVLVDESGASVYSTSAVARHELPDLDPTIRSAVSIGRRLIDPLAELVKLDPKTIGVGQYQHDVEQKLLAAALDDIVLSCVGSVGVDLNTASPSLLARVSGLSPATAGAIVKYRSERGPFQRRRDLLSVPRLGPKAFEQAAGFLRIPGADDHLDDSAVHPESYPIVDRMASDLGLTVRDLMDDPTLRHQIPLDCYVAPQIGLPTLQDILAELAQPGRDPRANFEPFQFAPDVHTLADLQPGMTVPGLVTNVTHFGAFVDVGLHDPGLIPTRHLANHPLSIHQPIQVTIQEVHPHQNHLTLSLHSPS